jgi:adenylylsulfate kinase
VPETRLRSLVKAISWRIISYSGMTMFLYLLTGEFLESAKQAFIISIGAIFLYWIHERVWLHVKWGRV